MHWSKNDTKGSQNRNQVVHILHQAESRVSWRQCQTYVHFASPGRKVFKFSLYLWFGKPKLVTRWQHSQPRDGKWRRQINLHSGFGKPELVPRWQYSPATGAQPRGGSTPPQWQHSPPGGSTAPREKEQIANLGKTILSMPRS